MKIKTWFARVNELLQRERTESQGWLQSQNSKNHEALQDLFELVRPLIEDDMSVLPLYKPVTKTAGEQVDQVTFVNASEKLRNGVLEGNVLAIGIVVGLYSLIKDKQHMVSVGGHCKEGENHCVCGGDLPAIREHCHNWVK